MTFPHWMGVALFAAALPVAPAAWAASVDVGVSVQISQPGVYGRIDIGRFPQPQVYVVQPPIVHAPRGPVYQLQPVHMWVPPGHRKNWRKHCSSYGACGTPVVFVRDDWYEREVRPHGKGDDKHYKHHGKPQGKHHDRGRGKGHRGGDDD